MDCALTSRFDTPFTLSSFRYRNRSFLAINRRFKPAYICAKRSPIDEVSDELNLIASQNLDHAPARRLARSAFVDLQLQLDHCLFKKAPEGIRTEELAKDFVVSGTASESLYGACEAMFKPDMEAVELFETISQALLSSVDRDCLSGWGGHVYVVTPNEVKERILKGRMD